MFPVGLLSALALALPSPILVVGVTAKGWTQTPGLALAGAAHIQPIAVGNILKT